MRNLKDISIAITFADAHQADHFNRSWHGIAGFDYAMRDIISAIPKDVDVCWGFSKERKTTRDCAGWFHAKNCVMRKIWRIYGPLQGINVGLKSLLRSTWGDGPIDGDGEDSDEE
jgi:hypothetical protein